MQLRGWLRPLIIRWENWLFAAEDAAARRRGWQVSRPPHEFGRSYRYPRWDVISECNSCSGNGRTTAPMSGVPRHGDTHREGATPASEGRRSPATIMDSREA